MIGFLKSWVINIAALSTFVVLLEIILPSGKTKRIVNLISGFILIIAIISPLAGIFNKNFNMSEYQIPGSTFLNRREIEDNAKILGEKQMKQIVNDYRRRLIGEIERVVGDLEGIGYVKADVIINEDYLTENFGEIKRIYLEAGLEKANGRVKGITPVSGVKRISIENKAKIINEINNDITKTNDTKNGKDINYTKDDKDINYIKGKIVLKITELFGVIPENIVITLG